MGPVDVVIVGSGPAGLGVAGELKRRGLEAVVLERAEAIAARWRSRYAGLRLNTFRAYSHLPGSPFPAKPVATPHWRRSWHTWRTTLGAAASMCAPAWRPSGWNVIELEAGA
ncbi:MAG: FAD-dependent monooxygenase [Solirubrobacterales bacterium]|nr:FAD-dependent monooxygenase [Solirubrobacterales bacterium]